MNTKKLAIAAAVSAAIGGSTGAFAMVTGIPGEAGLVPLVMSDSDDAIHTYVGLNVPETIGQDTMINMFTAPNVSTEGPLPHTQTAPATTQPPFTLHWVLFDENSGYVTNGYCNMSLGDATLWTTDPDVRDAQVAQNVGLADFSVPSATCGPGSAATPFGYVVFQTMLGGNGLDSEFAFAGAAGIVHDSTTVLSAYAGMASVPFIPMADSADIDENQDPALMNEAITEGSAASYGQGQPKTPASVAPIFAGIRMNNSDNDGNSDDVRMQAAIQGPQSDYANSLHVFWFDRNNSQRRPRMLVWDDHQGNCSDSWPMPREVNLVLYNTQVDITSPADIIPGVDWSGTNGGFASVNYNTDGRRMLDVIGVVKHAEFGTGSSTWCASQLPYWESFTNYDGALGGYVDYTFNEEGEPTGGEGQVNAAAVAFNWQQALDNAPGVEANWSSHPTTDLGKQ